MVELSEYEKQILLEIGGVPQDGLCWGAAMGQAIEYLQEDGLITIGDPCKLTTKGQEIFNDLNRAS